MKDFIFSDGTRVAKGEWVGIPVGPMLRDASKYPQPEVFDAFRFVDPTKLGRDHSVQPEGPSKFTDVSETWHVWGTGKLTWYVHNKQYIFLTDFYSSPGRFFVSYVMKHVMYHILENYEVDMVQKNQGYRMNWRTLTLPGLGVKAKFELRA